MYRKKVLDSEEKKKKKEKKTIPIVIMSVNPPRSHTPFVRNWAGPCNLHNTHPIYYSFANSINTHPSSSSTQSTNTALTDSSPGTGGERVVNISTDTEEIRQFLYTQSAQTL